MNLEISLFEGKDLQDLEDQMNQFSRNAKTDGFEVVDMKFAPITRDGYIYYFGQVTYKPEEY